MPNLRPASRADFDAGNAEIFRHPWVVQSDLGIVATVGAEPEGEGCVFWFEPGPHLRDGVSWLLRHTHEVLRKVCFGRFVLVSIPKGDRAMCLFASKAGFEFLESQGDRDLHYLSIK